MESKTCNDCKEDKPIDEFNWKNKSKGKRQPWCKSCWSIRNQRYYQGNLEHNQQRTLKRKEIIADKIFDYLLSHPCVDCGEADPVVLTFDHVRGDKMNEVSTLRTNGSSWETIEVEIAKCEVRCFNCHARKTSRQCGWRKANMYGLSMGELPSL